MNPSLIPCIFKKKLTFPLLNSRFVKSFRSACNSSELILKGYPDFLPDHGNIEADEGGEDFDGEGVDDEHQGAAAEEEGGGERGFEEAGG